jgi:hypothetical protein
VVEEKIEVEEHYRQKSDREETFSRRQKSCCIWIHGVVRLR